MKQLVATSLLLGYVMLVPFCLFGGMLMTHTDTMEMAANPAHHMHDCEMPFSGCAHTTEPGALDTAVHHISMYLSIAQTPLGVFSTMVTMLAVLLLVALGISHNWLRTFLAKTLHRPLPGRMDEPHISTAQSILAWLSLFESSPNFT